MALKMPKMGDMELCYKYLGAFFLVWENLSFRQDLTVIDWEPLPNHYIP